MKILEIQNNKLVISPQALGLSFLNDLWFRDKSIDKSKAFKDISYIYYLSDFNSPYFKYPPDQREGLIKETIVGMKDYKPDKKVEEAMVKYEELNKTPSMKLFETVTLTIDKMDKYFKTIEFEDLSPLDMAKVQDSIIKMPKLQEAIQTALDNCKKEQGNTGRARGGYKPGSYED